ncbi:MAG: 16S rRNA (cytosine(1402)-N(4))-methyltransferase RsmH [Rickettsiaceae bacterium]|nr:16S rRNA (cytosine(1402)-N(4))-methyltransferase RsmH [Rickettsiaceae bacterium]
MTNSNVAIEDISREQAPHISVMLDEVIAAIEPKDEGKYLDCTFGAGGYSRAILSAANCHVTALDQDPTTKTYVDELTLEFSKNFKFIETNFVKAGEILTNNKFDGVVLDLGVSSMQLDQADRGFSFMADGPLDMRMSNKGLSATEFINNASETEIADVIYKYGEEVQSRQIAKNIILERKKEPITTTMRLAEIVRSAMHFRKSKIDPATKTFQAIRIYVNQELLALEEFLEQMRDLLYPGGRVVIVSFHSLEDSIVKNFFKNHSAKKVARSKYHQEDKEEQLLESGIWLKIITKKPMIPTKEELTKNIRARSAKLRVAEKLRGEELC